MEIAYLHLVTNHIPIIGVPFGLAILAMGIWRKSAEIQAFAFLVFIVLGLLTLVVFLLGQGGEDFVEDLAGVSHDAIEDHEGAARFALASVLFTGALSLFALLRYGGLGLIRPRFRKSVTPESDDAPKETSKNFPLWIVVLVMLIGVSSAAVLGYTGRLGGKIRHTEFHQGTATEEDREEGEAEEADPERDGRRRRGRNRGGR